MPSRSLAQMSQVLIEQRQRDIWAKMASKEEPRFTADEEADVIQRAELYVMNVFPDRKFYELPATQNKIKWHPQGSEEDVSMSEQNSDAEDSEDEYSPHHLRRPQRKRRSYNNIDCYVTSQTQLMNMDNSCLLPLGTKLYKPVIKLIDMVTSAIQDSPDGLLQVQHLYAVLQNKYPYFRFMDKQAVKSWRSSVRHALYQRWFRKIMLETDEAKPRGHFWALRERIRRPELSIMPPIQALPLQYRALENGDHDTENMPREPSSCLQPVMRKVSRKPAHQQYLKDLDVNTGKGFYDRDKQKKKRSRTGKRKQRRSRLLTDTAAYFTPGSTQQGDPHSLLQYLQESQGVDLYQLHAKQQESGRAELLAGFSSQQTSTGVSSRTLYTYQCHEQSMIGVTPSVSSETTFMQHHVSQDTSTDGNFSVVQQYQVVKGAEPNMTAASLWKAGEWDITFAHEVLLRAAGINPEWILEQLQMVDGDDLNYIYYQVLKSKGVDVCTIYNEVQKTLQMDPNIYQRYQEMDVVDLCTSSPRPEETEELEFNIINVNLPPRKGESPDSSGMDSRQQVEMEENNVSTATSQEMAQYEGASISGLDSEIDVVGLEKFTPEIDLSVINPEISEEMATNQQLEEMDEVLTSGQQQQQQSMNEALPLGDVDMEADQQNECEDLVLDKQTVYRATLRQLGIEPNTVVLQYQELDSVLAYERRLEEEGLDPAIIYRNILQEFQTHLSSVQQQQQESGNLEPEVVWENEAFEACPQINTSDLLSLDSSSQQVPNADLDGVTKELLSFSEGQSSGASSSVLSCQFNIFSSDDPPTAKARTFKNLQEVASVYGIVVEEVPCESTSCPLCIQVNFHLPEGFPAADFDPSFLLHEMDCINTGSNSPELESIFSNPGPSSAECLLSNTFASDSQNCGSISQRVVPFSTSFGQPDHFAALGTSHLPSLTFSTYTMGSICTPVPSCSSSLQLPPLAASQPGLLSASLTPLPAPLPLSSCGQLAKAVTELSWEYPGWGK